MSAKQNPSLTERNALRMTSKKPLAAVYTGKILRVKKGFLSLCEKRINIS